MSSCVHLLSRWLFVVVPKLFLYASLLDLSQSLTLVSCAPSSSQKAALNAIITLHSRCYAELISHSLKKTQH